MPDRLNGKTALINDAASGLGADAVAVHCANRYQTIHCHSLHLGIVDTPLNLAAIQSSAGPKTMRTFLEKIQPMGRMATSQEMACHAPFLASDNASFVTSTELVVDGGRLAAAGSF